MDRRLFFKNLLGGAAAATIAPRLFDQIVEHDYIPETPIDVTHLDDPDKYKEFIFGFKDSGLWIFSNDILIAYGGYQGVSLEFKREVSEIRSIWHPEPYVNYFPGPMEGTWHVEDLIMENPNQMLDLNTPVDIVCRTPEHGTIESAAVCRSISAHSVTMTQSLWVADFDIVGEATIYA